MSQQPNIVTYIPQSIKIEFYKDILLHYAVDVMEIDITDYDVTKTIEYFNKLKEKGSLELGEMIGDSQHFCIIEQLIKDNFKFFFCGHSCPDYVEIHNVSGYNDFINDEFGRLKYGNDMEEKS